MTDGSRNRSDRGLHVAWQATMSWVVVTPLGTVDNDTAPLLDDALRQATARTSRTIPLLLDLRGTAALAPAALDVLLVWHRRCHEAGTSMLLGAPCPAVASALRTAEPSSNLAIVPQLPVWPAMAAR